MRRKQDKVDDIMRYRPPTVDINVTAGYAFDKIKKIEGRAIVVTKEKEPVHVITWLQAFKAPDDMLLSEMTGNMDRLITVRSGTLVSSIFNLLRQHRLIVILDKCDRMIGVMGATDLIK